MRTNTMNKFLQAAALVAAALGGIHSASAATTVVVPLTAQRATANLPDGSTVPMWGYCTPAGTLGTAGGNCSAVTTPPTVPAWTTGPTITVNAGDTLEIDLSNTLPVSTSVVILGQQGGNLGATDIARAGVITHSGQTQTTWPQGANGTNPTDGFTPPAQGRRALSFAPEAAANGTKTYTWANLKPGTYIYETGSRPSLQAPMGLYGTLIVTTGATPAVAGVPAVVDASGNIITPAIPGTAFVPGDAYPTYTDGNSVTHTTARSVPYDADAAMLFSEIDPVQNAAVDKAALAFTDELLTWTDDPKSACNDKTATGKACYPPAVNYSPRFFLINGQPFNPTAPQSFVIPPDVSSGNVLLRLLNAGLRTHVPTVAGTTVSLMAEDGNLAPGKPKVQSEVLLTAGKTYDVLLNPAQTLITPAAPPTPAVYGAPYIAATLSVFDRALNLTTNNTPFGGMQALILINGSGVASGSAGGVPSVLSARAINDVFTVAAGGTLNGNVRTNDLGVTTVVVGTQPSGTLTLNPNGTFTYTAGTTAGTDTFTYYANGTTAASAAPITATVTITVGSTGTLAAIPAAFTSKVATAYTATHPGVLSYVTDSANLALTAVLDAGATCAQVDLKKDGSFSVASPAPGATSCQFSFHAVNSQGSVSNSAIATVNFPGGSGITVAVLDTQTRQPIPTGPNAGDPSDYSWVIEEDRSFQHSGDPANGAATNTLATNFHVSHMPLVAAGCTGPRSCGDNNTVNGALPTPRPRSLPGDVALDFTANKRYYLSVVPADASDGAAADPVAGTPVVVGHGMGGAALLAVNSSVVVLTPQNPLPVANLSVYVFEDDTPTNGDVDDGEAGLGGFQINIFDVRGSSGDAAGQMTYDLAGMPMTNGLIGKPGCKEISSTDKATTAVGTIYTCPNAPVRVRPTRQAGETLAQFQIRLAAYQALLAQDAIDYKLAGMALIPNMIPGRVTVEAIPNAARSIAGEKWIQVSTLEGGKPVDTFVKAGEPAYWQEFGSPGFHSFIGFMNPDHVARTARRVGGKETLTGVVSSLHMDRPPNANLNDSCGAGTTGPAPVGGACRAAFQYTTCYVSLNTGLSGTGQNVAYTECDADGNFKLTNVPAGQHELVIWDQWLDQIIAKKAVTVPDTGGATPTDVGHIPVFSWFTRVEQSAYIDLNKNGVRDPGEPGVAQVPMTIRFRDGSVSNFLATDGDGVAAADELFPLFNWYVVESDTTRFKGTGVNVVYDAGGKTDTAPITINVLGGGTVTKDFSGVLNSTENPAAATATAVPGAMYTSGKTARIDPGTTLTEGVQGFINQTAIIDWGKAPYSAGENGGITGLVYYASTRGFDDPRLEVQFSWEPAVPRVPVNLYKKTVNADGTTSYLKIDSTTTSSWDDSAPNNTCRGQVADVFTTVALGGVPSKCYDGQHVFNQVQPAPYDGRYRFPSATLLAATTSPYIKNGSLVPGTYVVEVLPPSGYEIVKEEDKNILIGEPWNALGQTQFLGATNIFILPDNATLNSSNIAGAGLAFPPCVGAPHTVPDYLTLFPDNAQYAPFAGQDRALCDRKEVTLADQIQVNADFQIFTATPVAAHFVGMMLNDAAAEFDPISPSFGEKAALPNAPVSIRDFNGVEILRTYNDKWGTFNGMAPSTLAVNAPNPSGYSPNMLTTCMNDPGPIKDTRTGSKTFGQMIVDPQYNPMFSNFCYNWPFMPGSTVYLDTPVLPTAAFASASTYQPVDCQYPDATPAIKRVDGDGIGPWVLAAGARTIKITALGDADVLNPAYAGPTATTAGTNVPKIKRHYGFGTTGTAALRGLVNGVTTTTPLTCGPWGDTITCTIPSSLAAGYSGELIVTNNTSHRTSVDTVTVSIESVAPTIVEPVNTFAATYDPTLPDSLNYPQPVQTAIDKAKPGDLIILDAGSYPELVVMWKPVRLQGVGAASVMINATKFPNRKVADWRGRINALFGVDPILDTLDPNAQVSPLPGQTLTGGIVLLEPTVLSTEEGAGITVIASDGSLAGNVCPASFTGPGPVVTIDSSGATTPDTVPLVKVTGNDPSWSNFTCAVSSIDGVSVTGGDSGGGIYVNGFAHRLQIANNRVYGNAGPFSGGVRIGQPYLDSAVSSPVQADGSILGYNKNVNIHNNSITTNGMVEGNAAAGATAAGGAGGGLSICSGTDNYRVNYNFICGNFASSDGGGIGHLGLSNRGSIAFNQIIFNESYNQTSPQNGGGLVIEGELPVGATLSPGSGSVTVDANLIQGNFARAGSGGGLRLQDTNGADLLCELQNDTCQPGQAGLWQVRVTNNIIVNNLAGAAGGGVSLMDSFGALFNNNTIASNDSTGIAGNLFNTQVGALNTGAVTGVPGPAGVASEPTSPQVLAAIPAARRAARQVSTPNLVNNIIWQNRSFFFDGKRIDPVTKQIPLVASNNWSDAVTGSGAQLGAQSATGQCVAGAKYWDIGIVGDQTPVAPAVVTFTITSASHPGIGTALQQRTITAVTSVPNNLSPGDSITVSGYTAAGSLGYNTAASTVQLVLSPTSFTYRVTPPPPADLTAVGAGVLGGPAVAAQSRGLHASNSVLTPETLALYPGNGNISGGTNPLALFTKQYCNGSRVLPGVQFEPGTPFQPMFQLDAAATLDESGNFVDLHFGPISLNDPNPANLGVTNGNYHLPNTAAPGYNAGVITVPANNHDFDNDTRPRGNAGIDIGADQFRSSVPAAALTPSPLAFGPQNVGTTSAAQSLTYTNAGTSVLTVTAVTVGGANANNFAIANNGCAGITLQPGDTCTIDVTFAPTAAGARTGNVRVAAGGVATQQANLTGTGTGGPLATLTPATLDFGSVTVGTAGSAQTFTYTNTGTTTLTVATAGLVAGNGNPGSFAIGPNACTGAVLAPAATCIIQVSFAPTAAGARTATLRVTDTAGGATAQSSALTGTGLGVAVVQFSWGNNGTVGAWGNNASTRTITVTNTGTGSLILTAVALANVTGSEFSLAATQAANVCGSTTILATAGAASRCTLAITRVRPAAGAAAGTLTLTDTGAAATTQTLNLTGT